MEILIPAICLLLFFRIILKNPFFRLPGFPSWFGILMFSLKLAAAAALYFVYTEIYTKPEEADIFKYYSDSYFIDLARKNGDYAGYLKMLTGWPDTDNSIFANYYSKMNFWELEKNYSPFNDSQSMIRINAWIRLISGNSYSVHMLFFTFFSFTGLCALYRFFRYNLFGRDRLIAFAVFLVPSVMFWTSGVLKESLLILFTGLLLFTVTKLIKKGFKRSTFLVFCFALTGMIFIKMYALLLLLPLIAAYAWVTLKPGRVVLKYSLVTGFFLLVVFNLHHFPGSVDAMQMLSDRQKDFTTVAQGRLILRNDTSFILPERQDVVKSGNVFYIIPGRIYKYYNDPRNRNLKEAVATKDDIFYFVSDNTPAKSRFGISRLQPSPGSLIKLIPEGLFNTFIRPSMIDPSTKLTWITGLENSLVLLFMIFCLFTARKNNFHHLFLFGIIFTTGLFILIGTTVPILGAIVRYKVPALPFLVVGFGLLSEKLKDRRMLRD